MQEDRPVRGHGCLAGVVAALVLAAPASASFTQELGAPPTVGFHPLAAVAADINRDGRPDVVTMDEATVSVLLRKATGGFTLLGGAPIAVNSGPGGIEVADFDGDGRRDIAVAHFVAQNLLILKQQSNGTFAAESAALPFPFQPEGLVAGNFAGDGKLDLAVADWTNNQIRILRRDTGAFTMLAPGYDVGVSPFFLAAGNFGGSGGSDIAATNSDGGSVSVLLHQGSVFSTPADTYAVGLHPLGIIARDFNGDGALDLAVANTNSDNVSLLRRSATGGFAQEGLKPGTGDAPVGITAADFNSDGRLDIATANQNAGTATILLRTATGGWTADASSPAAADVGSSGIAAADFNADGRPDLAVANYTHSNVSILLNTTPRPVTPPVDLDIDDDGVNRPLDCDDNDPNRFPGHEDVPGDGIDQDCDGQDAPYPRLRRSLAYEYVAYTGGYMKLTALAVKPVRKGDRIRFRCSGPGCTKHKGSIRARKRKRSLSLLRFVKRAKLRKGAVISVRVTRPGTIGAYEELRFRGIKKPLKRERCIPPGTKKPVRC
jgi:hypothetical protein